MMKQMKKMVLGGIALLLVSFNAQAITFSQADCDNNTVECWTSDLNSNLSAADVTSLVGYTGSDTLTELYKSDVNDESDPIIGSSDSGSFADYYNTAFTTLGAPSNDPDSALISYVGEILNDPSINCPDCYVLVKDGNQTPNQYIFNLLDWNGTDDIFLKDFWLGSGGISHVSIYGGAAANVPEPGMVGLLAIGLLAMVVARRKMKL